jgi:prepilin-type N-terminal cleavage/methylation domain-containing protein
MRKAFTLVELVVSIAILVVVMAMSGVIFRAGIQSYRMAKANGEILRKFRVITDQLDSDLRGLCKEGEIFLVWPADPNGRRSGVDRMMFFAKGDFQSFRPDGTGRMVRGNVARVSYMLGSRVNADGSVTRPEALDAEPYERILQRTQHILIPPDDANGIAFDIPTTDTEWRDWHNVEEVDRTTVKQWLDMPRETKRDALSVIMNVKVDEPAVDPNSWGSQYDPNQPELYMHSILCQGVGQFSIQGWYESPDVNAVGQRWVPQDDPDEDGDFADSELRLDGRSDDEVPGVLYPRARRTYAFVRLDGAFRGQTYANLLDEEHFNEIPGLGRALKFTFTLYDAQSLIRDGRTFTHIVYLDN